MSKLGRDFCPPPGVLAYPPDALPEALYASSDPSVDMVVVPGMMSWIEVAYFDPNNYGSHPVTRRLDAALSDPRNIPGVTRPTDVPGAPAPFGAIEETSMYVKRGGTDLHIDKGHLPASTSLTQNPVYFWAERIAPYGTPYPEIVEALFELEHQMAAEDRFYPRTKVFLEAGDLAIVGSGIAHQVTALDNRLALLSATRTTDYPGKAEFEARQNSLANA
jgi:hypothetical protein